MESKALVIINISLALVALLLLLQFLNVALPSVGQALFLLDSAEPRCFVAWSKNSSPMLDLGRCCLGARQQLQCLAEEDVIQQTQWSCRTGALAYHLNNKAYHYCQQQVIWQ